MNSNEPESFKTIWTWHPGSEHPEGEGMYLLMVNQNPETFLPDDEIDPLVVDLGGEYATVGYWNGEAWINIVMDEDLFSDEDENLSVMAWRERGIE